MNTTISPVIFKVMETEGYLDSLATKMKDSLGDDSEYLLDYPALYIHVWRSKKDHQEDKYSIYIGETNDIIQRTNEHWAVARNPKSKGEKGAWQYHLVEDVDENNMKVVPMAFFIGHKFFHKSLTLDIENRLIDYCYAMPTANVYNGRPNPQGKYAGEEYLDVIFSKIWRYLRNEIPDLFLRETDIRKSALFKASPNHKLTDEQKEAKNIIIDRVLDAIQTKKTGQLIFVEGDAGTGKTVLTSSTLYDLMDNDLLAGTKRFLLVNHVEQLLVYENMAKKMGYEERIVFSPTEYLNKHSVLNSMTDTYEPDMDNLADVIFVDEAHLLWTDNNQSYVKKYRLPQLDEIIRRSRVTIIMFDEKQVVHKGQVFDPGYMEKMRERSKKQGPDPSGGINNYVELKKQLRMNCGKETITWIDGITKDLTVTDLILTNQDHDSKGYEVRIFDEPASMHEAIKKRAHSEEDKLSRIIATMDWQFKSRDDKNHWIVNIEDKNWSIPWHEQIYVHKKSSDELSKQEIKKYKMLDWAEKDYTLDEAGSIFTIQGFDLSYAGVILGPSVKYKKETKKIWFDIEEKKGTPRYMKGSKTKDNGEVMEVTDIISQNELRVLLTRATKGLYIYACDPDLRDALKASIHEKGK